MLLGAPPGERSGLPKAKKYGEIQTAGVPWSDLRRGRANLGSNLGLFICFFLHYMLHFFKIAVF